MPESNSDYQKAIEAVKNYEKKHGFISRQEINEVVSETLLCSADDVKKLFKTVSKDFPYSAFRERAGLPVS